MSSRQSCRRLLNDFTRGRIVGKLEEGQCVTSVAKEFWIAERSVSRAWGAFLQKTLAVRKFSNGCPRATMAADARYLVVQARGDRRQTEAEIAKRMQRTTRRPVSRFTLARKLQEGCLFARRPRYVPLMLAHRRRRFLWCEERKN